jgi:hypothetical protein
MGEAYPTWLTLAIRNENSRATLLVQLEEPRDDGNSFPVTEIALDITLTLSLFQFCTSSDQLPDICGPSRNLVLFVAGCLG